MKPEYRPLFDAGLHEIGLDDLEPRFVEPFGTTTRRKRLVERFRALIQRIGDWGIPFEVWVDGSFATEKPEPSDIDLLFVFDREGGNNAAPEIQADLLAVFSQDGRRETRVRYGCDVYMIMADDEDMRSYWRGWFGFTRGEAPKGIPYLRGGS